MQEGTVSLYPILEELNPDPPPCTPPSLLYKPTMDLGRLVGQRTPSTGQSSSSDILYQIRSVVSLRASSVPQGRQKPEGALRYDTLQKTAAGKRELEAAQGSEPHRQAPLGTNMQLALLWLQIRGVPPPKGLTRQFGTFGCSFFCLLVSPLEHRGHLITAAATTESFAQRAEARLRQRLAGDSAIPTQLLFLGVQDCPFPSSGVVVAFDSAQFFLVLGVSYFLLLEYQSSRGIPMEGRVITPNAAQSSWREKLLEKRQNNPVQRSLRAMRSEESEGRPHTVCTFLTWGSTKAGTDLCPL